MFFAVKQSFEVPHQFEDVEYPLESVVESFVDLPKISFGTNLEYFPGTDKIANGYLYIRINENEFVSRVDNIDGQSLGCNYPPPSDSARQTAGGVIHSGDESRCA